MLRLVLGSVDPPTEHSPRLRGLGVQSLGGLLAATVCMWGDLKEAGIRRGHPEVCIELVTSVFTVSICVCFVVNTGDLGSRAGLAALTVCSWGRCQAALMLTGPSYQCCLYFSA